MRRVLIGSLIALCMILIIVCAAFADGSQWHCEVCNADRDTMYCPICGAERPKTSTASASTTMNSWLCVECGEEFPLEYNYCPNDHTEKVVTSGYWPGMNLIGYGTQFKKLASETDRVQAYGGPGRRYGDVGGYKTWYNGTKINAYFRESEFVFVDLTYPTVGRRCLYFAAFSLTNSDVKEMNLRLYPAKLIRDVEPTYGPGSVYDQVKNSNQRPIKLNANTEVSVLFEVPDGWIFAEFNCELGTVRGWLPTGSVQ